jgi:hypothetical protein
VDAAAGSAERRSRRERRTLASDPYSGWKENVCPPIAASSINPSSPIVRTRTPSVYCAFDPAPALSATAVACPANRRFPFLKFSSVALVSKAMISVYVCP